MTTARKPTSLQALVELARDRLADPDNWMTSDGRQVLLPNTLSEPL